MNEGNLLLPKRKSQHSVVSTLTHRDTKKWMLKYNKMLYIIHPALKEGRENSEEYK